jgi:hypothetical protein
MSSADRLLPHSVQRPEGCGAVRPNLGIGIITTATITTIPVRSVVLA